MNYLEIPSDLNASGKLAYKIITDFLIKHEMTYTGGCKAFYSPVEWNDRGEKYGAKSHLVIVYDGGDLSRIFNSDYAALNGYKLYEDLSNSLREYDLFFEECTNWYGAVYSV